MKVFSFIVDWVGRLRVVTRLGMGFGAMLFFTLLVGAIGVGGMYRLNERINQVVVLNNAKLTFAQSMGRAVKEQEIAFLSLILVNNAAQREGIGTKIKFETDTYDHAKLGLTKLLALAACAGRGRHRCQNTCKRIVRGPSECQGIEAGV